MRYAKIKWVEIENGFGVGSSLFVQGCHFHCRGCFNPETWDFDLGERWTLDIEDAWLKRVADPFISRVSILGGEPLAEENRDEVIRILKRIRNDLPEKRVWLYTGFTLDEVPDDVKKLCDVIVDGQFDIDKKDISLLFRGSSNQNINTLDREVE